MQRNVQQTDPEHPNSGKHTRHFTASAWLGPTSKFDSKVWHSVNYLDAKCPHILLYYFKSNLKTPQSCLFFFELGVLIKNTHNKTPPTFPFQLGWKEQRC